jgi:hypothetical protein
MNRFVQCHTQPRSLYHNLEIKRQHLHLHGVLPAIHVQYLYAVSFAVCSNPEGLSTVVRAVLSHRTLKLHSLDHAVKFYNTGDH